MSILLASAGCMAASAEITEVDYSITFGEDTSERYTGYSNGDSGDYDEVIGSLSPSTFKGRTVAAIVTDTLPNPPILVVLIEGERSQDFFTEIQSTAAGTFETTNATFAYLPSPDLTRWFWEDPNLFPSSGSETLTLVG